MRYFVEIKAASDNEALISDTESVGDTEEQKINEQVQAINLNTSAAAGTSEFSEAEELKAEVFKAAGNEAFKSKKLNCSLTVTYKHAKILH